MSIRNKLLKAIKEVDIEEADSSVLVDLLVDKIKSQAEEIERANLTPLLRNQRLKEMNNGK